MPIAIEDVGRLQEYLRGVLDRAEHHARGVDQIALALVGAVIWRNEGTIKVMAREGEMKNVLWFETQDGRYALSYAHESGVIELRQGSTQGSVLASFSNATSIEELQSIFRDV